MQILFSEEAFKRGGHLERLLDESQEFAAELGSGLRERVYHETVPLLAAAIAERLHARAGEITSSDLDEALEQVMLILFRLLFIAYGEHKGLLPVDSNRHYQQHSLQQIVKELIDKNDLGESHSATHTSLWDRINRLWQAVDRGKRRVGGTGLQRRAVLDG